MAIAACTRCSYSASRIRYWLTISRDVTRLAARAAFSSARLVSATVERSRKVFGTLYSALYPTNTRYTGLSFVYQFSGVYASGVTPMILTALIAAARGAPWLACGYLVATAVVSVIATAKIREQDLHL